MVGPNQSEHVHTALLHYLNILLLGFIGSGHIARAIISGITSSGVLDCSKIYAADLLHKASLLLKEEMGINTVTNNYQVVENSDIVFLCVRPDVARSVLKSIAQCPLNQDFFTGNKVIISVCAGITIDDIIETFVSLFLTLIQYND